MLTAMVDLFDLAYVFLVLAVLNLGNELWLWLQKGEGQ